MAHVTIRNIPDDVYERLKRRAAENRRSLNQEIIGLLERVDGPPSSEAKEKFLAELRAVRRSMPSIATTDIEIAAAKRKGRP
jgi:antitoxin FitA